MAATTTSIECGEALTISNVAGLHSKLSKALETSSLIEIDVQSVEKVDTAGLQLLVALQQELSKSSGQLKWNKPSEVFTQAVAISGVASYLGFSE